MTALEWQKNGREQTYQRSTFSRRGTSDPAAHSQSLQHAPNADECLCSFAHRISPLHAVALLVLSHIGDQEEDCSVAGELFSANVVVID
jgi:hypothetical protein